MGVVMKGGCRECGHEGHIREGIEGVAMNRGKRGVVKSCTPPYTTMMC